MKKKSMFPSSIELLMAHLDKKGVTLAQLARELGLYPQVLYNWKNGKSFPSFKYVEPICTYLEIDKEKMKEALYYDKGRQAFHRIEQRKNSGTPMRRSKSVKLYEQFSRLIDKKGKSVGQEDSIMRNLIPIPVVLDPLNPKEGIMGFVALPKEAIIDKDSLFAYVITEDVSVDLGILPGDTVVIQPDKELTDGDIVLAANNGHLFIRRLFNQDGNVILTGATAPIIAKIEDLNIIGCVIYSIRKH